MSNTPIASEGWRIGVLFSRSGLSALTECEHLRGTTLAIEEINQAGGVRGLPLVPVTRDPQSSPTIYRQMARQLIVDEGVTTIFGCSHSASRKAVLPLVERHDALLFYPSVYEGFEYSENVIYAGPTLNQCAFPLADFLIRRYGKRIGFVGADYIFPRESNRAMRDILESKGATITGEVYAPLDASTAEVAGLIGHIRDWQADAIFSTVIGGPARQLYRMYAEAGFETEQRPIASLTMAETEIAEIGTEYCRGHVLSASYFQSLPSDQNQRFVAAYKARFGAEATTSVWSQTAYLQVYLLAHALERAGSLEPSALAPHLLGQSMPAPEGTVTVDQENRHLWLTPRIGTMRADGQFDVAWQASGSVRPDPYLATARFDEVWV
ncbi:transporter substrate-binding domain-containing protein [Paracoccus sulfuroxidans]|uniref:Branched-chain amino acid transport system substrate-binding protein n=1 Tax=Paracoccus sulfuroxidans TaxID=384678 RepID=A0A562NH36_9RHOB|nr:transporter substrate-binding domain-containing protein [Paracoccus sulfuroxidans]TWI31221.1 branched-chain amino acid transport system substrate-binding protein [Paracoccus sulfuroxidans]